MTPPKFLTGHHPHRGLLWASIDLNMHHIGSAIGETRFASYLKPFPSEEAAREALHYAGAYNVEVEPGKKRRGR